MVKNPEMKTTALTSPSLNVDPWIIEQFSKRPKEAWIRDKLSDYYTKEIMDLKLESLKKELLSKLRLLEVDADTTQRVFVEQKGKWSLIPKRYEVEEIKSAVTGWSTWFRRMIVGIILFLIGTGGTAAWKYAELNVRVENSEKERDRLSKENDNLWASQEQLNRKVETLSNSFKCTQVVPRYPTE